MFTDFKSAAGSIAGMTSFSKTLSSQSDLDHCGLSLPVLLKIALLTTEDSDLLLKEVCLSANQMIASVMKQIYCLDGDHLQYCYELLLFGVSLFD